MRIRFETLSDGPGPSETLVGIETAEGRREEVVISKRQASTGGIDVGAPIAVEKDKYLVELPRESVSGAWRIWVREAGVLDPIMAAE